MSRPLKALHQTLSLSWPTPVLEQMQRTDEAFTRLQNAHAAYVTQMNVLTRMLSETQIEIQTTRPDDIELEEGPKKTTLSAPQGPTPWATRDEAVVLIEHTERYAQGLVILWDGNRVFTAWEYHGPDMRPASLRGWTVTGTKTLPTSAETPRDLDAAKSYAEKWVRAELKPHLNRQP